MTSETMNMDLAAEALPVIDESELGFGVTMAPPPEGFYAVNSRLGKNGLKVKAGAKGGQVFTVHAVNEIVKPLKYVSPLGAGVPVDEDALFKKKDGSSREIHDFFRISADNTMGITKAIKFLKAAGDPSYNKYATTKDLAEAVVSALKEGPDTIKLKGQWSASVEDVEKSRIAGKKVYESVRGMNRFPLKDDGSRNHVIELQGEYVGAQFEVQEYGELTPKDVA